MASVCTTASVFATEASASRLSPWRAFVAGPLKESGGRPALRCRRHRTGPGTQGRRFDVVEGDDLALARPVVERGAALLHRDRRRVTQHRAPPEARQRALGALDLGEHRRAVRTDRRDPSHVQEDLEGLTRGRGQRLDVLALEDPQARSRHQLRDPDGQRAGLRVELDAPHGLGFAIRTIPPRVAATRTSSVCCTVRSSDSCVPPLERTDQYEGIMKKESAHQPPEHRQLRRMSTPHPMPMYLSVLLPPSAAAIAAAAGGGPPIDAPAAGGPNPPGAAPPGGAPNPPGAGAPKPPGAVGPWPGGGVPKPPPGGGAPKPPCAGAGDG